MSRCPTIRATYRLQLHAGFPLAAARALVPYLSRLGVSHVHCSPLLRSRQGSTHGYDVVDPRGSTRSSAPRPNSRRCTPSSRAHGMGIVLDIVPNHMAASARTRRGTTCSPTARPRATPAGSTSTGGRASGSCARRVLLPVLGERAPRGPRARRDTLAVERGRAARPLLRAELSARSRHAGPGARGRGSRLRARVGRAHPACQELAGIARALRRVPRRSVRALRGDRPRAARQSARRSRRLRELAARRYRRSRG